MGKTSSIGRWALYGIILSLLFTSTGYAQGRQSASVNKLESNDRIVELAKEVDTLKVRHNDLDRDIQQTRSELQEARSQLQGQIGDNIKAVTETARNHITYATWVPGAFLTIFAIAWIYSTYKSKQEFDELKKGIGDTLRERVSEIDSEVVEFKDTIKTELSIYKDSTTAIEKNMREDFKEYKEHTERELEKLKEYKEKLRPVEEIWRGLNSKFEAPEKIKAHILHLLLYSYQSDSLQFQRLLHDELCRLGGHEPPNRPASAQRPTDEDGGNKS